MPEGKSFQTNAFLLDVYSFSSEYFRPSHRIDMSPLSFFLCFFLWQVHFIGEVAGATGFAERALFAKWKIEPSSDKWRVLDGQTSGRTCLAERDASEDIGLWNDPINVGFASSGLQGWPKLRLEIYSTDAHGAIDLGSFA